MIKGFFNVPWFAWAAIALGLSVVWVFVGPHTKLPADSTWRFFVIRWAHALTWLLLAVSFFLRGLSPRFDGLANVLAIAGGLAYAAFILVTYVI